MFFNEALLGGGSKGGNAKATFGTLAVAPGRDLFSSKRILPKASGFCLEFFFKAPKSTLECGFTPRKGPKFGIAQQFLAGPLKKIAFFIKKKCKKMPRGDLRTALKNQRKQTQNFYPEKSHFFNRICGFIITGWVVSPLKPHL